ncbi:RPA-related protein RADX [Lepisosteus oculatus]|uniref:RPA-related protein RADX n=1 Tax=Lepisosteus oculatus TaxID=7918 RepID=UPI003717B1FF
MNMVPEVGDSSSSSAVAQRSPIWVAFDKLVASTALRQENDDAEFVAVVAVQRYLTEPKVSSNNNQFPHSYCFDVTVTDGVCRAKCHLAHDLNHLVHKNKLRTGIEIRITKCSFVYDERRLGQGSVCIEQVEFGSQNSNILYVTNDVFSLPVWSKQGVMNLTVLQNDAPLKFGRKHYLPLWNNEDPYGELWIPYVPPRDVMVDVSKVISLSELESCTRCPNLPLLVRIMHKSKLRFYGKPETKLDVPYQAYFEVADQSGMMSLVLWNSLCPEWYQRMKLGTVLFLQSYGLKQSYQWRTRPTPGDSQLQRFTSVEISLNPRDPAAIINIIPPKDVLEQWKLPDVSYHFITRSELDGLPHNHTCDVIGLVTFVGRCERIKTKGAPDQEKYWTYRWVHAMDGTSDTPFILEIFSTSQPEIFSRIQPMTFLVCTQMRVCRDASHSVPYLTSSNETQIFITGCHKGQPYTSNPQVKSFIQWTKTQTDAGALKRSVIGGHYYFPPAPPVFTQTITDGTAQVPVVATKELKKEMDSLQYREHKRLAIQGLITAVEYVVWPEKESGTSEQASLINAPETVNPSTMSPAQREQDAAGLAVDNYFVSDPEEDVPSSKESVLSSKSSKSNGQVESHTQQKRRMDKQKHKVAKRRYLTRAAARAQRVIEAQESGQISEELEESADSEPEQDSEPQERDTEAHGADHLNRNTLERLKLEKDPSCSWESTAWSDLKGQLQEHFSFDFLHPESIPRKFDCENKEFLLQYNNLHPEKWIPEVFSVEQDINQYTPVVHNGYYKVTILGINHQTAINALFLPVMSPEDPRSVGLPNDPHDNTLFSFLTTGFVCPEHSTDSVGTQPVFLAPGEIIQNSAASLDNLHVICLLDFYNLGDQKTEVFINKVYKMTDAVLV